MSEYSDDRRVLLHADGTASVPDVVWEPELWKVVESGDGGFFAVSEDGYLAVMTSVGGELRPWRFASRDDAIGALLESPR